MFWLWKHWLASRSSPSPTQHRMPLPSVTGTGVLTLPCWENYLYKLVQTCTNCVNFVNFVNSALLATYIGCPVVALGLAADADGHIVPAVLVVTVLAVVTTVTSVLLVLVPAHNHNQS